MNDYYEVDIKLSQPGDDAADLMAALLADEGYESFVPAADGLTAYVPAATYSAKVLKAVCDDFPMGDVVSAKATLMEGRDWNEEWERNYFQPIVIAGRCVVHSTFHTAVPEAEYEIIIDPRMAFGTGHHATTTLMLTRLLDMNLKGKSVIDMGTGTGILALLAAKRGAAPVTGIEIDEFAYENALDNLPLNGQPDIRLVNGDASVLGGLEPADVFLANINRNVITADIASYSAALRPGGLMQLSGFYRGDVPVILDAARPYGLEQVACDVNADGDPWTCLTLQKNI